MPIMLFLFENNKWEITGKDNCQGRQHLAVLLHEGATVMLILLLFHMDHLPIILLLQKRGPLDFF